MSSCALNTPAGNDGSCLTGDHVSMISKYNSGKDIKEIKRVTKCSTDECILENSSLPDSVRSRIKREAFKAPTSSHDGNYWLNNTEIDTVMSQLRRAYPGFSHGFIHMIDLKSFPPDNVETFDYSVDDVGAIDFGKEFKHGLIRAGKIPGSSSSYRPKLSTYDNAPLHSYGIICNTDASTGRGQHWFAVFISTDSRDPHNPKQPMIVIELFNSAGGGVASAEFNAFWETTAISIARETGLRCVCKIVSSIEHQRPDTGNCGAYSLFYIYCRLQGVHSSEFDNPTRKIQDQSMQAFRKVCFRLEESVF